MSRPILVSIEANIGAGKSTILQKLQETIDPTYTTCIEEPIDVWSTYKDPTTGRSLLDLYYTNPSKYAFPLQTMIYNSLMRILYQTIDSTSTPIIITERSLQSSSGIFAKMLNDSGIMSPIEYQVYKHSVVSDPIPLDVCIYLRTKPEICYERIRHRNRQGEQKIEMEYLRTCHSAHETWIKEIQTANSNTIVYTIEVGVKTPKQILAEVLEILSDLMHS